MELFKDLSGIELFIAFFVPGFIIVSVWEYFVPSERSDWQSRIPQVVGYSSLYYAFALGPYFVIPSPYKLSYLYGAVFLLPILVGVAIALIGGAAITAKRGAQETPWDQLFGRVASDSAFKNGVYVQVQLKDSTAVTGYFGAKSHASAFPNSHELYLQRVFEPDVSGNLVPASPETGALVDCSEISVLRISLDLPATSRRQTSADVATK